MKPLDHENELLRAPEKVSEITAQWLSAALALRYPETRVESFEIGHIIPGTATKVQLHLVLNQAGQKHSLPNTIWFKGGLEEHSGTDSLLSVYAGEVNFYSNIAPNLSIDLPDIYAAFTDPVSRRAVLLMEDLLLRNVTFGHASEPASPEMVMRILSQLAKLHARYWGSDELKNIDGLSGGGALLSGGVIEGMFETENWDRCTNLAQGKYLTGPMRQREQFRDKMLSMLKYDADNAHCLVHGDPHLGNIFFDPEKGPGYLDWQTAMHGFWAHDVADVMTTSMTIEDRRLSEHELIEHYVRELAENGVTLASDLAWYEYRRHAIYNLGWGLCPPEWQPEDVCCANIERAAAAVIDLGTMDLW